MGARTKYTPPVVRLEYIYINCASFLTAPKTRQRGIVLYPRILLKLLRGLTPVLYPIRSTAALKGEEGKTVGIVPSDMALLNFSLSGKRSRINAMD